MEEGAEKNKGEQEEGRRVRNSEEKDDVWLLGYKEDRQADRNRPRCELSSL